jgi:hypothetical protein
VTVRLQAQRLLEDFFGLLFAAVGDVDVGLSDRIDLVRVELRRSRDEARVEGAGRARVDALAAGLAEQRVRAPSVAPEPPSPFSTRRLR